MTKPEFLIHMAEQPALINLTKTALSGIYDALFSGTGVIAKHLVNNDNVRLGDLGTLKVKSMPARKGRNPATGAEVQIPASRKVTFQVCKTLKDIVK